MATSSTGPDPHARGDVATIAFAASTYARVDVTVKVVDGEDDGKVDALCEGAAGRQFGELPRSQDEDGGETAVKWQWYRGGSLNHP